MRRSRIIDLAVGLALLLAGSALWVSLFAAQTQARRGEQLAAQVSTACATEPLLRPVAEDTCAQARTIVIQRSEQGVPGLPGLPGAAGERGAEGPRGVPGPGGPPGPIGPKGDKGETGQRGDQGQPGTNGTKGSDGKDGTPGQPGKDGQQGTPGRPPAGFAFTANGQDYRCTPNTPPDPGTAPSYTCQSVEPPTPTATPEPTPTPEPGPATS